MVAQLSCRSECPAQTWGKMPLGGKQLLQLVCTQHTLEQSLGALPVQTRRQPGLGTENIQCEQPGRAIAAVMSNQRQPIATAGSITDLRQRRQEQWPSTPRSNIGKAWASGSDIVPSRLVPTFDRYQRTPFSTQPGVLVGTHHLLKRKLSQRRRSTHRPVRHPAPAHVYRLRSAIADDNGAQAHPRLYQAFALALYLLRTTAWVIISDVWFISKHLHRRVLAEGFTGLNDTFTHWHHPFMKGHIRQVTAIALLLIVRGVSTGLRSAPQRVLTTNGKRKRLEPLASAPRRPLIAQRERCLAQRRRRTTGFYSIGVS